MGRTQQRLESASAAQPGAGPAEAPRPQLFTVEAKNQPPRPPPGAPRAYGKNQPRMFREASRADHPFL